MDFSLFMERYGYKALLAIGILIVGGVVAFPVIGLILTFRRFGVYFGAGILVLTLYFMLINRKTLDAYGKAQGKYFYDPKYGKKP